MKRKLAAVAFAALAPVVAIMGYNEIVSRKARATEVHAQAAEAARLASSEVQRIIEGLRGLLIAVSALPAVQNFDRAPCDSALESIAANVSSIRTVLALDLEGRLLCGSANSPLNSTFADRDYFQRALSSGDFVVGVYTKSRLTDTAILPLAIPIIREGVTVGVLSTGVRLDWLQERLDERAAGPGSAITIADRSGSILARMPFPERFVGTVIPSTFQKLLTADAPGTLEVKSQDGTERIMGYRPISLPREPLYVSAGFSRQEAFAPINRASIVNALSIAGGALLAFLAATLIGNRFILRPVKQLAGVMEAWRAGDNTARTGFVPGRDELSVVGVTLDRLLDELQARQRHNEQITGERLLLAGELSHRVKNSFALIQAIARQTFRRTQPELYASFEGRLAVLAKSHDLLLSRENKSASMRDTVQAAVDGHAGSTQGRFRLDGAEFVLGPDLTLPLSLILHELATNAMKYGALSVETGHVTISWIIESSWVSLEWNEIGGPEVKPPARRGFGSALIHRAFPPQAEAHAVFDYRPGGLVFALSFNLAQNPSETGAVKSGPA